MCYFFTTANVNLKKIEMKGKAFRDHFGFAFGAMGTFCLIAAYFIFPRAAQWPAETREIVSYVLFIVGTLAMIYGKNFRKGVKTLFADFVGVFRPLMER